jgi:hypothetical protein
MASIEIDLSCGIGKVLIDGQPLHQVTKIEITCTPGKPTEAKLTVYAAGVKVKDTAGNVAIETIEL